MAHRADSYRSLAAFLLAKDRGKKARRQEGKKARRQEGKKARRPEGNKLLQLSSLCLPIFLHT